MKKVFISVPMRGRTKKNIDNSIKQMHKMAEIFFGEKLEPIYTVIKDKSPEDSNESVYKLGESIKLLSKADYFIGIEGPSMNYRGCFIETLIAEKYCIPSYIIDSYKLNKCSFFQDIFNNTSEEDYKSC